MKKLEEYFTEELNKVLPGLLDVNRYALTRDCLRLATEHYAKDYALSQNRPKKILYQSCPVCGCAMPSDEHLLRELKKTVLEAFDEPAPENKAQARIDTLIAMLKERGYRQKEIGK